PTKTSQLQNDSGFITNSVDDLTNYYKKTETYTKTEVDNKVSSVYKYKGSVATYQDLPSSGQVVGDVYNVESDGSNYAWNGTTWDKLGGDIDLSDYYTKTQTDSILSGKQATLVSGTNIKTINSASILSSGNLTLEDSTNKVTSISSSSTDTQYPSAKCVYDIVGDVESLLETLDTGNGV
ncbi:hypothetical protein IKS57_03700, partial [bacterium]|nr:hypothetical protein [bacterium]